MKKIILLLALSLLAFATPSHAVVNSTISQNEYACNSSNTSWNYTFPIILPTDIQVYTIDSMGNSTQQTSNFSVNTFTQTVTYPLTGIPCATGYSLLLERIEPFTQLVAASNQGPAPSPVVMTMSDKLTMLAQQLSNNSVQSSPGTVGNVTLPAYIAGDLIAWSSTLNQLSNVANPSAVAQWSLSGANISYNVGNVSTTNNMTAANMTANNFYGILQGNGTSGINWSSIPSISTANINWNNINLMQAGGMNWPSITAAQLQATGINWPSIKNYSSTNWSILVSSTTAGANWDNMYGIAPSGGLFSNTNVGGLFGTWSQPTCSSVGISYHAATDLVVMAYAGTNDYVQCYTDSNSSPSTMRMFGGYGASLTQGGGCSMPVKKNDYWKITTSGSTPVCNVLSIGS